jgi:hypothetical protein
MLKLAGRKKKKLSRTVVQKPSLGCVCGGEEPLRIMACYTPAERVCETILAELRPNASAKWTFRRYPATTRQRFAIGVAPRIDNPAIRRASTLAEDPLLLGSWRGLGFPGGA